MQFDQHNAQHPPLCILKLIFVLHYNCFNFGDLFSYRSTTSPWEQSSPQTMQTYSWPTLKPSMNSIILLIWNHSASELTSFIDHLNSCHDTIKFTQTTSSQEITFWTWSNNSYQTKTHFKPTNTFSYLHGSSNETKTWALLSSLLLIHLA